MTQKTKENCYSNSNHPLVSVIITCYNYGNYLREAIDSALNQSYSPLEVIVIDDGSTDDSGKVAKSYGKKITYLQQKNAGVVAARNNGFKVSKGEIVCFLDADDYFHPDFIKALMQPLLDQSRTIDLVYSDVQYVGLQTDRFRPKRWNPYRLLFENYITNSSALMTRESFEFVGMYSDYMAGKYGFEDWELWIKYVKNKLRGAYVPKALYYYRIHGKGRNADGERNRQQQIELIKKHHPELYQNKRITLIVNINKAYWLVRRKFAGLIKFFY